MDRTETPFGLFGSLPAYGTIHDDCVFLDHALYFHAFIPESPSGDCACGFEGPRLGEGFISDCSYLGFVSGFGAILHL
jgi:hypothetical protein